MNKKLIIWVVLVVIIVIGFFAISNKGKTVGVDPMLSLGVPFTESRPYCFGRLQEATTDAPYRVEEHMELTRVRGEIAGTKTGTQAGPDMTNGFTGTMVGGMKDDKLEFTFSYTIEGVKQKEIEIYQIDGQNLVKYRYVLKDQIQNNEIILVPDQTTAPTLITYTTEVCSG